MEWRAIRGYTGLYEVSDEGQVRRIKPYRGTMPIIISPGKNRKGYLHVTLSKDDMKKTFDIHRLVAKAFLGHSTRNKPHVNHKDGNKTHNHKNNLEWSSYTQNMKHADEVLRVFPFRGSKHPRAKLSEKDVSTIKRMKKRGIKVRKIANRFSITESMIYYILRGDNWMHINT